MGHFFDNILRFSYSSGLHQHLKGLDPQTCNSYSGTDIYSWIFLWMLLISLLFEINFYYGLFNRPKLANIWMWLLNVIVACTIVFVMAYLRVDGDLRHNNYCKELHFNATDCMLFGCTAATYTLIFCFIFSVLIKWKSLNNKKVPF